jgi:phage gp16-like protein
MSDETPAAEQPAHEDRDPEPEHRDGARAEAASSQPPLGVDHIERILAELAKLPEQVIYALKEAATTAKATADKAETVAEQAAEHVPGDKPEDTHTQDRRKPTMGEKWLFGRNAR